LFARLRALLFHQRSDNQGRDHRGYDGDRRLWPCRRKSADVVGLRKNPFSAAGFYSRILRGLTFRQLVKGSGRSSRQLGDLICQPDDCRLAIFVDGLLDVGATLFHVQWTIGCKGNRWPCRLPWAGAAFLNCLFRTRKRHAKIRKLSIIAETNLRDRVGRASQLPSPQKPPADFTTYFRQRAGFCQRFRPETLMRIRSGIAKGSTSTIARPFGLILAIPYSAC
jgi:hypothetical protein